MSVRLRRRWVWNPSTWPEVLATLWRLLSGAAESSPLPGGVNFQRVPEGLNQDPGLEHRIAQQDRHHGTLAFRRVKFSKAVTSIYHLEYFVKRNLPFLRFFRILLILFL